MSAVRYYLHNNGVVRDSSACPGEGVYCMPRPVVVLDPEDREQVERLRRTFFESWSGCDGAADGAMSSALRSLLLAEGDVDMPTDPAARVRDRDGDVWARQGARWGCLTTASAPQAWMDLVNVCGPLEVIR